VAPPRRVQALSEVVVVVVQMRLETPRQLASDRASQQAWDDAVRAQEYLAFRRAEGQRRALHRPRLYLRFNPPATCPPRFACELRAESGLFGLFMPAPSPSLQPQKRRKQDRDLTSHPDPRRARKGGNRAGGVDATGPVLRKCCQVCLLASLARAAALSISKLCDAIFCAEDCNPVRSPRGHRCVGNWNVVPTGDEAGTTP
jgi:hypothetical protein